MDELAQWRAWRRRRRHLIAMVWLVVGVAVATAAWWLARPAPLPAPTEGAVLPGGAVIAWSPATG